MNAFSLSELPAAEWNRQLAAMQANGVQMVRSDADWGTIEPNPPGPSGPSWQFSSTDAWVTALAENHLAWEPILDYDNSWAMATRDNADFASYAAAVAARYGDHGSFWAEHRSLPYLPVQIFEVWNEENGQPWYISPKQYGPLYAAVHTAIHAVDPQASVDVGGLSDDSGNFDPGQDYPSWYLIQLFGYYPNLEGNIDGFALHPYATTAKDATEWLTEFRMVLNHYNESAAPIDITEFGWVTGDSSEEQWRASQMSTLGTLFSRAEDCGLREVAPYDWVNPTSTGDPGDFGFVARSATSTVLRPAAVAWFHAFNTGRWESSIGLCASTPFTGTLASNIAIRRKHVSHRHRAQRRGERADATSARTSSPQSQHSRRA